MCAGLHAIHPCVYNSHYDLACCCWRCSAALCAVNNSLSSVTKGLCGCSPAAAAAAAAMNSVFRTHGTASNRICLASEMSRRARLYAISRGCTPASVHVPFDQIRAPECCPRPLRHISRTGDVGGFLSNSRDLIHARAFVRTSYMIKSLRPPNRGGVGVGMHSNGIQTNKNARPIDTNILKHTHTE